MSGIMIAALIPMCLCILLCYCMLNNPMILVYGAIIVIAFIIQPFTTLFGLLVLGFVGMCKAGA